MSNCPMSPLRDKPRSAMPFVSSLRMVGLILIPVLLLTGIAMLGLVEYRHAITANAREEMERQVTREWMDRLLEGIGAAARESPVVRLYPELPEVSDAPSSAEARLQAATETRDIEAMRRLARSDEHTMAGLPVSVLAAWRLFRLTEDRSDAEHLAALANHEAPSPVSAPIIVALLDAFPDRTDWRDDWLGQEEKRAVLRRHPDARGFVWGEEGPVYIEEGHVLGSRDLRERTDQALAGLQKPAWMALDITIQDRSLMEPVRQPMVTLGSDLKIVAGIGNPSLLYANYWRMAGWIAALILCALATAVTGLWLVSRTLARERKLGEQKSQFVASVSHELRAPIASMRLMADLLRAGNVNNGKARDFHRLMSIEGARLSALIENVLDLARIEEGGRDYRFAEADLAALVVDAVLLMEPVARERQVRLVRRFEHSGRSAWLDAAAMERAIVNLLDNAIKFSPAEGEVRVTLESIGPDWRLSVSNRGVGIPASDRDRVFERFTRLGNELRRETKGAGIGLSLVKHIVDAHGGTIEVTGSDTETCFVMQCRHVRGEHPVRVARKRSRENHAPAGG